MCGTDDGYRIYNTDPLKENAREGIYVFNSLKFKSSLPETELIDLTTLLYAKIVRFLITCYDLN
jgi:hypothetical protein